MSAKETANLLALCKAWLNPESSGATCKEDHETYVNCAQQLLGVVTHSIVDQKKTCPKKSH
jgi:hypothetical protein